MLSFSLINETSTKYYVDPSEMASVIGLSDPEPDQKSFLDTYLNPDQTAPDESTAPVEDDKYARDELGDIRYDKDGSPLEKSDVGVSGFIKRIVGKSNYDRIQNGGRDIDLSSLFASKSKPAVKQKYDDPEDRWW